MALRVFVDANVLFSRTLRDWLFMLRLETGVGVFQLHTTWDVINETGAKLRDKHSKAPGSLIANLMNKCQEHFDEILEDFPGGPVVSIADEGDWHVHHAAEASRADILLTEDAGFDSDGSNYEAYNCDDFFVEVYTSAPDAVKRVVEHQARYWAARGGMQLPDALRAARCPKFASAVLGHIKQMALTGK
ncbi:PIN domain-containing protein [Specibacter sp. NPDC057265]|uniref:PIN domain-containing protein n=1 Tax=Specibacter sp. NPDC057265 TaxID=3346075 RepID=UPI00363D619F